jgi:hypothetical protein
MVCILPGARDASWRVPGVADPRENSVRWERHVMSPFSCFGICLKTLRTPVESTAPPGDGDWLETLLICSHL